MTQTLFSLSLTAEAAASLVRTDPDRSESKLRGVQELAGRALRELRSLIFELRPPDLEKEGLVAAVGKHLDLVGRAHGLAVTLEARGDRRLPLDVETQLFRVVQEALSNVVRHAGASSVRVGIEVDPAGVCVTVRDDGVGFDPSARAISARRLGLTSMRERAQALGGTFAVDSAPGRGTAVRVEVPGA